MTPPEPLSRWLSARNRTTTRSAKFPRVCPCVLKKKKVTVVLFQGHPFLYLIQQSANRKVKSVYNY